MEEIWRDIPTYEGYYQASNFGRIKSLLFQSNIYNKKYQREKILKPKQTKDGCLRVELWKDGEHRTWLTYRLVALAFLGVPEDKTMTINHKDGNRLNNHISNLEWCTRRENIQHGFRTGLYKYQKPILLTDKESNVIYEFISMTKASEYIGHNHGYISSKVKENVFEDARYSWVV